MEKWVDCQLGVGKHVHIPDANYDTLYNSNVCTVIK